VDADGTADMAMMVHSLNKGIGAGDFLV